MTNEELIRELRTALGRIGYITDTNFDDAAEMALAIDRIHDIAFEILEKTR